MLSGIVFVNRNGLRWCDAPREYGPYKTLYNRWKRWGERGVFVCIMDVHIDDLADLYARALDRGMEVALYHAAAAEANLRLMAETIVRHLGVPVRSVSVEESAEIWDRFMGPIVFSGCSRTRSPRSHGELGWRPSPDKADILAECVKPSYVEATERAPPSWVRKP